MSRITETKINLKGKPYRLMTEYYNNSAEMVNDLRKRPLTNSAFEDKSTETFGAWHGCKTYEECLEYLRNGYQPVVDTLKAAVKPAVTNKRITFQNNIVGGNPVVPLALMGVPNCMIDTRIKPIKAKVLDVYYDITCSSSTESEDIIEAGQKLLAAILKLEQSGYRFNLYAVQTYSDNSSCDMLAIKVKSSDQPLDLKRMSYTLTHTSFFRVLGFDWYSRTPKGKYRGSGYGRNFADNFDYDGKKLDAWAKQFFGSNTIFLSAMVMNRNYRHRKDEYINMMINTDKNTK